jgi:hypothetical protein
MVTPVAQSIGLDAADAEDAVALAIEQKWLLGTGEPRIAFASRMRDAF